MGIFKKFFRRKHGVPEQPAQEPEEWLPECKIGFYGPASRLMGMEVPINDPMIIGRLHPMDGADIGWQNAPEMSRKVARITFETHRGQWVLKVEYLGCNKSSKEDLMRVKRANGDNLIVPKGQTAYLQDGDRGFVMKDYYFIVAIS